MVVLAAVRGCGLHVYGDGTLLCCCITVELQNSTIRTGDSKQLSLLRVHRQSLVRPLSYDCFVQCTTLTYLAWETGGCQHRIPSYMQAFSSLPDAFFSRMTLVW